MEEIKVLIAIPTAGTVRTGFAYSLARMMAWLERFKLPSRADAKLLVDVDVVESPSWITNREQLVMRAIKGEFTHILFLDDDLIFEPQIIDILFSRRHPAVCTNYLIKSEPPQHFVAVGLDGQRIPTKETSTGLISISYSGFGVSLFDLEVFKKIPQPWFMPQWVEAVKEYTTEDNPCYRAIREAGYTVYLDHDASKLIMHMGNKVWKWNDVKFDEIKEQENG